MFYCSHSWCTIICRRHHLWWGRQACVFAFKTVLLHFLSSRPSNVTPIFPLSGLQGCKFISRSFMLHFYTSTSHLESTLWPLRERIWPPKPPQKARLRCGGQFPKWGLISAILQRAPGESPTTGKRKDLDILACISGEPMINLKGKISKVFENI